VIRPEQKTLRREFASTVRRYAKVENQSDCCSLVMALKNGSQAGGEFGRCGPSSMTGNDLQDRLADLLRRYNVNDYAASVRVFALKPVSA
jgi:hypothetical protein